MQDSAPQPLISLPEALTTGAVLTAGFLLDGTFQRDHDKADGTPLALEVTNEFGNGAFVLPVLGVGWFVGRQMDNETVERTFANAVFSGLLAAAAAQALKFAVGRVRPNESSSSTEFHPFTGEDAFPSGHASYASAVLASLAMESSSRALRYAAYSGMAGAAIARVYVNRHWTSDVLAGTALGIVSARAVARWRSPKTGSGLQVTPNGIAVRIVF